MQRPTRLQVPASTPFDGGEGAVHRDGHVLFTTKGDGRIWDLDLRSERCTVLYDAATTSGADLNGVDNIATSGGGIYVAEDGGNMELCSSAPTGRPSRACGWSARPLEITAGVRSIGHRLYFSSQRGRRVGHHLRGGRSVRRFRRRALAADG
jgi:hypothetical protein